MGEEVMGERDIKEEQVQWAKKKEEDHEEALQQLADSVSGKDAAFLSSAMAGKKRKADADDEDEGESGDESDEEGLGALERGAVARIQKERDSEKKVKGLLPIKTKDGGKSTLE